MYYIIFSFIFITIISCSTKKQKQEYFGISFGESYPKKGGCSAGVYYQKTFLGFKVGEVEVVKEVKNGELVNASTPCNCLTGDITPYNPNA